MNKLIIALVLFCTGFSTHAQTVAQLKSELETTPDIVKYIKFKLNKKYKIDTINIASTSSFLGTPDSLAYFGKEGKVYGPYKGKTNSYLIKILGKAPNTFYHVSHILLDTSIFRPKFADSLAKAIITKIRSGKSSFASMASAYSSDNATITTGGDLGWFCLTAMLPPLAKAISYHKKGDIFEVWTERGVHVVTINDEPKKDTGYALMLKVIL